VSDRRPSSAIRRILVALDASPHSLKALETAVEFAARMQAELAGLFVEDIELLRLAESPYASEILYPSATIAPLHRAGMESKLRAHSEQARKALAAAADRARVSWSFRTARGDVTSEVLAAAAEADLLAMAALGGSLGRGFGLGSAALELALNTIPVLLLPVHGLPFKGDLLVLYDGSRDARRRIPFARELARAGANRITVLIAAADNERAMRMQDELAAMLDDCGAEVNYRSFDPKDEAALLRAVKAEKAGVLLLTGRKSLEKLPRLEKFLGEREIPVLLLCNGREAEAE
jgi:nucleotide-binding universal stress UspA family protein